jgi:chemotaxis protein CheD
MTQQGITRFGKTVHLIYVGDYHVDSSDIIIGTLLGSCISVCLYDPVAHISGMNHFMLPGRMTSVDHEQERSAKFGITAISDLLQAMYMKGAKKDRLQAKLFGGGAVLNLEKKTTSVPTGNIRIARVMMELEDIPIVQEDTGGKYIRKIFLEVQTGMVFLKRTLRPEGHEDIKQIFEKGIGDLDDQSIGY